MNTSPLVGSAVFLFGLIMGSFLNVCIWRLPEEEEVVKERSHCRNCHRVIAWYDNIPLLSFVWLKGRCRFCHSKISWTYPLVELMTGLLFLGVWFRFGTTAMAAIYGVLGTSLILISGVDARSMWIPDQVTLPGLQLGVILSFFFPVLHGTSSRWGGLWQGVLGALAGTGVIFGMGALGKLLFRRKLKAIGEEEAVGGGDLKLMAMVGSFIGWAKVLLVCLLLAPLLGSMVGLVAKYRDGRDLIPYGPFLALGTILAIFWGNQMIQWYRVPFMGF